ncbi:hypothetical protein [Pseudomonas reinekei]
MNSTQIRAVWLATLLLSIPLIAAVPVWPSFLTGQLAWGSLALLTTATAIFVLRSRQEKQLANELFSVLIGLGAGLIASQIFTHS